MKSPSLYNWPHSGVEPAWGQARNFIGVKRKEEEEKGERRKKKREEVEGAP